MIDGYFKAKIDKFWDFIARYLSRTGLTPNTITWIGLILILINCLFYLYHKNNIYFGLLLAFSFSFDALDGAVARVTSNKSQYGGYLDAIIDRYQEVAIYLTLAFVNDFWVVCFFAITGSLLISYNKARTAIETPIDNDSWPDLMERLERIIVICAALVLDPFIKLPGNFSESFLYYMIFLIAILTHITAIQRFLRARKILLKN